MKRFFILLFGTALFGCSSDDNSGGNNSSATTFLPQKQGNYWVYDVESDEFSGRDSLYVSGTTTSGGNTYHTYATSDIPSGFYSGLMTGGTTRASNSKLLMTGVVSLGDVFGEGLGLDFGIDLNDFVIFDSEALQDITLDSESGEFEIPYEGMTIRVEYTLSSKTGQSHSNYSVPNGDSYSNVKSVIVAVSAKISVIVPGFPIPVPLLNTQDIINSTQYYANNVGVVFVNTDFKYNLNEIPIPGNELPLPQSYSSNTKEVLDDYSVE